MSPKITQEQKDKRKADILKAAKQVFRRKGFELATMKDVIEASGFSRGGVYLYFSSTEDMFQHIFEEDFEESMKNLKELVRSENSVWDIILAYIGDLTKGLENVADSFTPVEFEYFFSSWRNDNRKAYIFKRYDTIVSYFTELLQKGTDSGEFHPLQPLETIVKFFISTNDAIIMQTIYLGKTKADTAGQIEALTNYLKHVLQVR
ncbi:TetR family transcriptional regulator [Bacillus swezeyi]|uniref:TetR family transcriptional regulator n=1 Tax=Bacillus swezeyi TaxID=1925020 RepID=UPI003F89F0F9